MTTRQKLYWLGNAAKSRIIGNILKLVENKENVLIFDYGCGDGGDWPAICTDYPQIRLIGYEPSQSSFEKSKGRLKSKNALILTGNDLDQETFQADFIVSFSVLEHVRDRVEYFNTAKRYLATGGIFFLNYDDGHFRNTLDLSRPALWPYQALPWFLTLGSKVLGGLMPTSLYQRPVSEDEVGDLVQETGFRVVGDEFANLVSLKRLFATVPPESQHDYCNFWQQVEERLNTDFSCGSSEHGKAMKNLWQEMYSRTMQLVHY